MDKGSELTLLQKGHTDGQYTYEKMDTLKKKTFVNVLFNKALI